MPDINEMLFQMNNTCCLVVSYRSAIKVATAFAPKNSVFQLWEEDACAFCSFNFFCLKLEESFPTDSNFELA